ncbi:MAG: hypothetical protein ITG07_09530 [Candidimonas sp.]|nr:hypothetical protein [Candidimonas sp.]
MTSTNLPPQPTSQDRALLRTTLLKLTAGQKILCAVVIAVVALVWYDLLNRLVEFGRGINYEGLHALGARVVTLLKEYNPFFWWAVVALCTLIIAYFLYGFVRAALNRARARHLREETVQMLATRLSEPAREVLRWSWRDPREPLTVGDLQRTAAELRNGRYAKITLARRQAALLAAPPSAPASPKDLPSA